MLAAFQRVYDLGDREPRPNLVGIIMDEAFSKLSGDQIDACLELARNFGLQLAMAFSEDRLPTMIEHADLEREIRVETGCARLLTIENAKTTFRQFTAADPSGTTLLVASSFPTRALETLLHKLLMNVEHHHFGDPDPYGFLILQMIRQVSPRPVLRFRMEWRPSDSVVPLTSAEVDVLDRLLEGRELRNCCSDLLKMRSARSKGQFEQETLCPPRCHGWPFQLDPSARADQSGIGHG